MLESDAMSEPYVFPSIGAFRNRAEERKALTTWYEDDAEWRVMMLVGRRRVGKSWLFRAFAHGREADIFVASTRGRVDQLSGFADQLTRDGERPALPDIESFLRLLYRRARDRRRLAVIDELPFLWTADRDLPSVMLKVIEEEAASSRLKLIIAGSHVGMMERLLAEREPLHDRLRPLPVRALDLWRAREMLDVSSPEQVLTAFAIAGGLPRYLAEVSGPGDPVARLAAACLDPRGPLFDEPRAILAQELEVPHTYFSILAALSSGPRPWGDLVSRSGIESSRLARYLRTLEDLELVKARMPITDVERSGRHRRYEIDDGFLRFWFRFVFPFQADLEAGLSPEAVMRAEILPRLADHLAPTIEEVARGWVRRTGFAGVTRVGSWWGPALDEHRAAGERTNEEIDIVGTARGRVVMIGEVRWRSKPMDVGVLGEIERFKLPALRRVTTVEARPQVMLVSRSGFTDGLRLAASRDASIQLVGLDELVAG
jgi:AAA+ ATPase superfamily predicted ATPase